MAVLKHEGNHEICLQERLVMLAPKPYKLICSCGYSKIVRFKSDCLSGADLAQMGDTCPKCGQSMREVPLSLFEHLFKKT